MIEIRPATTNDLDAIFEMVQSLSAHHGDKATVTKSHLCDIFFGPQPMGTALIAHRGGTAVGYAGLTPTMVLHEGAIRLDIHHLFVQAPHRGQGVGTTLIKAAKAFAIDLGATRLTIGTDENNTETIATYRHMDMLEEMTAGGPRFRISLD